MTTTANKPASTKPMTAATFIREYAARQRPLLEALRDSIQRGEVQLESGAKSDRFVERVIGAWCEHDEPNTDVHLQMLGAVFLTALYDELYAVEEDEVVGDENGNATAADVAVEVLRTIQAIWGQHATKKR